MPGTLTVRDGTDVRVEHVDALPNGAARFDVEADTRKWRIDVSRNGSVEVVTAWRDGQLDDVELPEWMDDVVGRLNSLASK